MLEIQKNLTNVNKTVLAKRDIKYIVVHYTGNKGDTAYNNTKYFKSVNRSASAHYFVDENSIWQCVEDKDSAWHCGAKKYYHEDCRNNNSIGIEMCNSQSRNSEVEKNTIELIFYLMNLYDISVENIIRHYDVTHKKCPVSLLNDTDWENFKSKIIVPCVENIEEFTTPNDIAWDLSARGILLNKDGFITEINNNPNGRLYWFSRKLLHYIRTKEIVSNKISEDYIPEFATPNDITWDLCHRGIVEDKNGFIDELNINGRLYWLARKGLQYVRCRW